MIGTHARPTVPAPLERRIEGLESPRKRVSPLLVLLAGVCLADVIAVVCSLLATSSPRQH